ncbi:hypothetical protein KY290_015372 [Solanum tuberosum]|uniref:Transcription factor n=1 Tax=Solanum tuberosum TaxID=4113 RepID=A0ABQ7VTN0_SOLTU|nr:hypothetical protein KY289_014977 [Solanum tuberosum]KAH0771391.1 hypothetical protein KY290_015372 [Solanum tuberosum]
MNNRFRPSLHPKKVPLNPQKEKKMEIQQNKFLSVEKPRVNRRQAAKERKLALLQDVDKLKKKLRHEENIHRALERAFYRPLGTLPRLPPYLPKYTLELLAEVAVLEEEVVRLEEQVVNYRQGLYQEAVSTFSRRNTDGNHLSDSYPQLHGKVSKQRHSRSFSMSEVNLGSSVPQSSLFLDRSASSRKLFLKESVFGSSRISYDVTSNNRQAVMKNCNDSLIDGLRKENHSAGSCTKDKPSPQKQVSTINTLLVRPPVKPESISKIADVRVQCRAVEQAQESYLASSDEQELEAESTENKISEDILKCLSSILLRLSTSKGKIANTESFRSLGAKVLNERELQDPYCICSEQRKQDIGEYRYILNIDANSVNLNQKMNASFLIHRLKILLGKLSSVKLEGLTHQQKLAFWINTYNSCVMNAFIEHGIPETAEQVVSLMQKATINVGGHFLNAIMIEHFILRLPYHLKYTCSKSAKDTELKVRSVFGLEWSEPLVTFALSCGSWSSPAVRVYTASQVETQLETAKRDYLQAAVGISATNKLIIPKLLDWYLLDFAKDLDALLDWVCLQLPDELRNQTMKCLERRGREPLSQLVQVMPYNFSFRQQYRIVANSILCIS